jgi:hypothetical protein
MNRKFFSSNIATLIVGSALLTGSFFVPGQLTAADSSHSASSHAAVVNPTVPHSMTFAGEKVDLDREDMYERLDRELTSMAFTHGNTLLTIKRANRYFPVMAPILKQQGIHLDFLYLACIESYLNPLARSGVGAAGIWQFMPATAKQYGLEVSDEVDERYDLEKETVAACKYFRSAYSQFGDWESVAASFNGGTGRISSERSAQMVDSAFDLYLVEETRRYPYRMLAMKLIMENPSHYGYKLTANQLYAPYSYSTVQVACAVDDWAVWAKNHGITYATLRDYNPWIRAKKLTNKAGKTYSVRIPTDKSMRRSSKKTDVYNSNWIK